MESSEAIESSDKTLGMLVIMLLSPSNNNNKNTKNNNNDSLIFNSDYTKKYESKLSS